MKISIYQRYIIKSIIIPLSFCLIILTGMVWLSQILRLLFLFEKQVNLLDFLNVVILLIPALVHTILPFATLYSSLYVFNNMKVNKELIVLENAGFNPRQLMQPLFKLSLIITAIGIINSCYILPKTYGILKDRLSYYRSNFTSLMVNEGIFNNISKNVVLYIDRKISDQEFEGLVLFDTRDQSNSSILLADKGEMNFNNNNISFDLYKGSRQSISSKGTFEIMSFDNFKITVSTAKSAPREKEHKDIQERYIWELLFPKVLYEKSYPKLFAEGNNRLVWPALNIILPLVAISIFLKADFNRRDYLKQLTKAFLAALIFVAMHFIILSYASREIYLNILLYLNIAIGALVYYFNTAPHIIAKAF